MGNEVYANNMELACKAGKGKSICAFPDVCFTPPLTPATPPGVPIPYPNTGMAGDTTDGSKTVQISGQEVMLKNKSFFKQSTGDEAGSAPKKGVITSQIKGKVYFNAWSMDVKFESENVVRNLDITTHNHASFPGNSPTWPFLDAAAFSGTGPCSSVAATVNSKCSKHAKPYLKKKGKQTVLPDRKRAAAMTAMCKDKQCKKALKCVLSPKSPSNCCPQPQPSPPKQTPHHIVLDSQFNSGTGGRLSLASGGTYDYASAPCICAHGVSHSTGLHGKIHTETNNLTVNHPSVKGFVTGKTIDDKARWKVNEAESVGAKAVAKKTKCDEGCIKSQTRRGHKKMGIEGSDEIRPTTAGKVTRIPKTGPSTY
jgi:hypothetical protein